MMQFKRFGSRNQVVFSPTLCGSIATTGKESMQRGQVNGPFDVKVVAASFQQRARALEPEEQKRFMRAVERCTSIRDRALALLLFYTAPRVGECAGLNTDDIALSARKGKVTVRAGKGDVYREVALNTEAREG
jgi:integrase